MSMTPQSFYNLAMTSDNYTDADGNTFITSASAVYDSGTPAYKPFDGQPVSNDCWHPTSGVPQWLKIQVSNPVKILGFTMKNRVGFIEHPTAMIFQGSNDDTTWDDLASLSWPEGGTGLSKDFTIPDYSSYYTYFRWYITGVTYSPYGVIAKIVFTDVAIDPGVTDLVYKRVQQGYSQGASTYTEDGTHLKILAFNAEAYNIGGSGTGATATITTDGTVSLTDVQTSTGSGSNRNAQSRLSLLQVESGDTITLSNMPYTSHAQQAHLLFDGTKIRSFSNVAFAAYTDASNDHKYEYTATSAKVLLCICWNEDTYGLSTSVSISHSGTYNTLYEDTFEDAQSSILIGIYDVSANDVITLSTNAGVTAYGTQLYAIYEVTLSQDTNKFLLESAGDYYSIINDVLTNVGSTLNAQLFADYGMTDIPDYADYSSLTNPSVLCWNDEEEVEMQATVRGVPNPQIVYSQDVDMSNSTITGIDSVEVTSDEDTLFAMSFDSGTTWWNYLNNQWVQLSTATAGQDKDSLEDIPTNAWAQKAITGHIMFRFTLLDTTAYVTEIFINFTN